MSAEDSRSYDPRLMQYDGLAAAIASDSETYEGFLGFGFGGKADYLHPDMPSLQALYEASKKNVDEKHLVDPDFLRAALQGLITAREERGARL